MRTGREGWDGTLHAMSLVPRAHVLSNVREVSHAQRGEVLAAGESRQISVLSQGVRTGPLSVGQPIAPAQALSEAYYANIYFYACVRAIATDLAARPFRVGADPENVRDFNPKHPLALRLSPPPQGPNPTTSARRLWAWSAAQRLVLGAVAWELDSELNFWPVPGTQIEAIRQDKGAAVGRTGSWFKEFKIGSGRGTRTLKADKVFYSWNPAQDDWTRPETPLEAARLDIQVMVMQDIYDHAFLRNDARPATLVVHQAFTSPEEERKFRRQFLNRHQGPNNAGRVAFAQASPAEGGAAPKDSVFIQQIGLTQRDAQMVERYDAKLRSVCVAMGVPLSRLGDASKRTFSNADRETLNYWLDTVQPLGYDMADDVNLHLMPLFDGSGNVGWFDWSGVPDLEPARRFAVPEVLQMHSARIVSGEEARTELGFDPDGLPAPIVEANPVDNGTDGIPNPVSIVPEAVAASAPVTASQVAAIVRDALRPLQARLRSDTPVGDAIVSDLEAAREARGAVWRKVDTTTRRIEGTWERAMSKLLARQLDAVTTRLSGKRGRQALRDADPTAPNVSVDVVFDKSFWQAQTVDTFDELYRDVVGTALADYEVSFGVAFDLDALWAKDYIAERSNYLAGHVTDTTYDAIKTALIDGAAEGESIPALAARIEHLFTVTWDSRATTVARTEVISAYNGSTWLATHNAPEDIIGGLQWIATSDDRTRATHSAMDGTIIRRGEAFYLDGATLMFPGDPEVATRFDSSGNLPSPASMIVNCRCTCAPVLTKELPEREAPRGITRAVAERLLAQVATGSIGVVAAMRALDPPRVSAPTPAPAPVPDAPARLEVQLLQAPQPRMVIERDASGAIIAITPTP